jgi:hypothetical protein
MTVCVGVSVYDGLVFAADSASSIVETDSSGRSIVSNVYRHGNKVFNLVRRRPLVSMTCGMGNFGHAPIAALSKDLRHLFGDTESPFHINGDSYTVGDVAKKAKDFFAARYASVTPAPKPPHSFQYWVGGFSSNSEQAEVWRIDMENGDFKEPAEQFPGSGSFLVWGGQPEAISRLVLGYSPLVENALARYGLNETQISEVFSEFQRDTSPSAMVNASMPIQDAIELAEFLVDTTKRFVRFLPGADTVGGDTDIAVVTRHERFKWIKRKHYYPAHLNVLETDHV